MRSALILLVLAVSVPARPDPITTSSIAEWLRGAAVDTADGRSWPEDALAPAGVDVDLGAGSAGAVLFWIAKHRAHGDDASLDQIRRGADYLAARARKTIEPAFRGEWTTGLYGPIAGSAFVLHESYRYTRDERHRAAAMGLVELLHASALRDASGAAWGTTHDVLTGAAGTGLFLLYAAREMKHAPSLALARDVGKKLLLRGVPDASGGMTWKGSYEVRFVLPNFSHGTAGIAYFLASLHEATGDAEFLSGARAGATWLRNVADRSDEGFRLFYGWPDPGWARRYDIGWAHGPAGTARLFYKLWRITGEEQWRELVRACARSLRASGLPATPKPEYGAAFDFSQRFGIAGTARFFLDLYAMDRDPADRAFAETLLDEIRSAPRWKTERYGFMERRGEKAEFTGYFYGAAGYGLVLLAGESPASTLRLPDDPFGAPSP